MDHVKRIWYLSSMRAAKIQASLRIRAVSPEPSLLAHTSSESRGTFRQKARSQASLNGWTCSVKICQDRMLEDTNSVDGAHIILEYSRLSANKQALEFKHKQLFAGYQQHIKSTGISAISTHVRVSSRNFTVLQLQFYQLTVNLSNFTSDLFTRYLQGRNLLENKLLWKFYYFIKTNQTSKVNAKIYCR